MKPKLKPVTKPSKPSIISSQGTGGTRLLARFYEVAKRMCERDKPLIIEALRARMPREYPDNYFAGWGKCKRKIN